MTDPNPHTNPSAGARLRELMRTGTVAAPGAFNGLVARAAAAAGFEALYVSGAAVSAVSGVPDIGLVSVDGFARVIREVTDASGLPVLADADTGFGEAEMVARTVWAYHEAGGAGMHIEDQEFPKRCGHLGGKRLIAPEHMAEKVEWAARARSTSGGDFVICARTDARGVDGLEAALERAKRYLDAGADMIFPEGLADEGEFEAVARTLEGYGPGGRPFLLANMTEFGKTPMIPLARFAELGYSLVIYPVTTLRIAMKAVIDALEIMRREGGAASLLDVMQTRQELYRLLEYTPGMPWAYPTPTHKPNR